MLHSITHGHMGFRRPNFGEFNCCYVRALFRPFYPKLDQMRIWFTVDGHTHDVSDLATDVEIMNAVTNAPDTATAFRLLNEWRSKWLIQNSPSSE